MSTAAASAPAAAPAAPAVESTNTSSIADRIASKIPDDFDLGDGPEESAETSLDVSNFFDDDDGPDPDSEDTKPETPKKKPPVVPQEAPKEAPEPKAAKSPLPTDKGTEGKPYGVNDLPADKYVKIKVDGKEQTLPMRELADGYIRKQTFDSALSKANKAAVDAEHIATSALAERKKLRGDVDNFLNTPEQIFKVLLNRDPDKLLELGSLIGQQYGEWQKDPTARQRHDWERQQREIQASRQQVEREKSEWQQTQQRTQAAEAARKTFEPLYREAMKEAGFPKVTPKFQRTLKALVATAERDGNGKLTADEFKDCVRTAAKVAGSETVAERAPAAPVNPAREPAVTARRPQKKDWESMPHSQRIRDPDFLLRKR